MAESEALAVDNPSFGASTGGVFERLMQRHRKQAYHVAYRMTGNHADAEDLLQEAFVRAFRFFDNYRRDLPFEKWLFRIMSNLFVDGIRKKNRMRTTSLDAPLLGESESNLFLDIPDARTEPERVTLHEELEVHHAGGDAVLSRDRGGSARGQTAADARARRAPDPDPQFRFLA